MPWNPADYDQDWPFELMGTTFDLEAATTALLVIDLQTSQLGARPELTEKCPQIAAYWQDEIDKRVLPNTVRLLDYFRGRDLKVVYTRNGCLTATGQEVTWRLRPAQPLTQGYRGTPGYEIDERVAPLESELVVDKPTSGAFTCSWLDHALRNMGVEGVVIVGVVSDMCVLGTARTAAELGYRTAIGEDACASFTQRAHLEAMLMHARKFGRVIQTPEIIAELDRS